MHSERTYRTESGIYTESELGLLVWLNPEHTTKPQSRLLSTMTDHSSINPMAFPISLLRRNKMFSACPTAEDANITELLFSSAPERPVIIPIPVARAQLGWEEFFVPTRYAEPGSR